MADLAAKQVLDTLSARLHAMPQTGPRVYTQRNVELQESDLPCWRFVAGDEPVDPLSMQGHNMHALQMRASVYARAALGLDDELSALLAAGQALLFAEPRPWALQLTGVERDLVDVGEASAGRYTLNLVARYVVDPAQPDTLLSS